MGSKRARMSAEEVDFICGVRKDGKTHKDYNKATGRDNYLFRLTDDEFKVLAKYRDVQEEAQEHEYNYAGMIDETIKKLIFILALIAILTMPIWFILFVIQIIM